MLSRPRSDSEVHWFWAARSLVHPEFGHRVYTRISLRGKPKEELVSGLAPAETRPVRHSYLYQNEAAGPRLGLSLHGAP